MCREDDGERAARAVRKSVRTGCRFWLAELLQKRATLTTLMSSISALVKSSKKVLRNEVTKQLQALKDAEVERQCESCEYELLIETFYHHAPASSVLRRLLELEAFHNSRIISCYLSMKGEVDTSPIVHEILGSGTDLRDSSDGKG